MDPNAYVEIPAPPIATFEDARIPQTSVTTATLTMVRNGRVIAANAAQDAQRSERRQRQRRQWMCLGCQ